MYLIYLHISYALHSLCLRAYLLSLIIHFFLFFIASRYQSNSLHINSIISLLRFTEILYFHYQLTSLFSFRLSLLHPDRTSSLANNISSPVSSPPLSLLGVEQEMDAGGDPSTRQVIKPLPLLVPLRNSPVAAGRVKY